MDAPPPATAVACVLCGGAPTPRFEKEEIPYFACGSCGFVFSRPAENANFATGIDDYEPAYLDYLEDGPEDEANHRATLDWARSFGDPQAPVLDVGAGGGKFVRYLRQQGFEARGLEPAAALFQRFLRAEEGFWQATPEELAARPDRPRFGTIFACDVLEHVAEPGPFLAALAQLLEPGGRLLVSTPDVGSAFARVCGPRWHYYNRYHLSYFDRRTLSGLAARFGFRELGFARLPRRKSVGYLLQYGLDFVLGGGRLRLPEGVRGLMLPINLHDTMYVAFERP